MKLRDYEDMTGHRRPAMTVIRARGADYWSWRCTFGCGDAEFELPANPAHDEARRHAHVCKEFIAALSRYDVNRLMSAGEL